MISSVTALLAGVLGEGSARTRNLIIRIAGRQTAALAAAVIGMVAAAPGGSAGGADHSWVQRFEIELRDGRASSGDVRVSKGDRVELVWTADTTIELHLHGYDIELTLTAGARATMAFTAYATGRFPVTVHQIGPGDRHETLLYVEVHPR